MGYYLFENNLYISRKSLIFYIVSIILFIILFFLELIYNSATTDLDVKINYIISLFINYAYLHLYTFEIIYTSLFIIFTIFLFLVIYFNKNEILLVKQIYSKRYQKSINTKNMYFYQYSLL